MMAATKATAVGNDWHRSKVVTRLGNRSSFVEAATWHTFARAEVFEDGSGYVKVYRDSRVIHEFYFGNESTSDE